MQIIGTTSTLALPQESLFSPQRRNLAGACLAHMLHDGYTDQLYALLPVWQPKGFEVDGETMG